MKQLLSLLFLFIPTLILAQELQVPEAVGLYRLVRCEVKSDGTDKVTGCAWDALGVGIDPATNRPTFMVPDMAVSDSTMTMNMVGPPGQYRILVFVSRESGRPLSLSKMVTISGTGPVPPGPNPPGPNPPGPTPVLDEIGQASYALLIKLPTIAQDKVPDVAKVYRSIVARMEDGRLVSIGEATKALSEERSLAMGDVNTWKAWVDGMSPVWTKYWTDRDGKPTKTEIIQFYKSIAASLEAVKSAPVTPVKPVAPEKRSDLDKKLDQLKQLVEEEIEPVHEREKNRRVTLD